MHLQTSECSHGTLTISDDSIPQPRSPKHPDIRPGAVIHMISLSTGFQRDGGGYIYNDIKEGSNCVRRGTQERWYKPIAGPTK